MIHTSFFSKLCCRAAKPVAASLAGLVLIAVLNLLAYAHPLGNFTVNHFSRLQLNPDRISVRYIIDLAEIPAFQTLQALDTDNDGKPSAEELAAYAEQKASGYADGLHLTVDGVRLELQKNSAKITTPTGTGGLPTVRLEYEFFARLQAKTATRNLQFEDTNDKERIGWHEIVIAPNAGLAVFDSTAFANSVTDELRAYPEDLVASPLNERSAALSFTSTAMPANAKALMTREGRAVTATRDKFAELIAVKELTFPVALLGLLIAAFLGGVHAMSPGHGKTVVGAYLVGSRGTPKHAAFLGLTVTITHTIGVIALGLVTLFASQYVVPERLFPIISLLSGVIVFGLGVSLFYKRLRAALGKSHDSHDHAHDHQGHSHSADDHQHTHSHEPQAHSLDEHLHHHDHEYAAAHRHSHEGHSHTHAHSLDHHGYEIQTPDAAPHHHPEPPPSTVEASAADSRLQTPDSGLEAFTHTHDGHTHTHLPPGTDGAKITWRSLLALGISGGLLPCPSALVVLLSAISLQRIGYGLLLVVAFSVGLAATLTSVGLMFLYAGQLLKRPAGARNHALVKVLPVLSALVIACAGAVICYEAIVTSGFK
jgi:ABC-type nickel/cobalt efflux system permease component RcnA